MEYVFIEEQSFLDFYVSDMKGASILAIDTEFMRKEKYYPEVCLIQISYKKGFAIVIDCLKSLDLTETMKVIYNPNIKKVFHSGRQDMEIFLYLNNKLPTNIFDTQLALLGLNIGQNLSYEKMVKYLLDVELDKNLTVSNWFKRPLSKDQIKYAAFDVLYLYLLYEKIMQLLNKHNKLHWVANLFLPLENPSYYDSNLNKILLKFCDTSHDPNFLNTAKDLLQWREQLAKNINIAKKLILKDEVIAELSQLRPSTTDELASILDDTIIELYGTEIIEVITSVNQDNIISKDSFMPTNYVNHLNNGQKDLLNILRTLLNNVADKYKIHADLICIQEDLACLIINIDKLETLAFATWKYEVFINDAIDFLLGKVSIKVQDNCLVLHVLDELTQHTTKE